MKRRILADFRLLVVLAQTQTAFYRIRQACRYNNIDEKRFLRWWLEHAGSVNAETQQLRQENARLRHIIRKIHTPCPN